MEGISRVNMTKSWAQSQAHGRMPREESYIKYQKLLGMRRIPQYLP